MKPVQSAEPGGIDFFDVDHTLTRRSSGGRFVSAAMRRKSATSEIRPMIL